MLFRYSQFLSSLFEIDEAREIRSWIKFFLFHFRIESSGSGPLNANVERPHKINNVAESLELATHVSDCCWKVVPGKPDDERRDGQDRVFVPKF